MPPPATPSHGTPAGAAVPTLGASVDSNDSVDAAVTTRTKKGIVFWCIFSSICVALFLSALDQTAVSTALPTIAHDLHTTDFVWVGSAYALSSTAFLPMSGGMAQIFGRRPALLSCLFLFALGSGICGGARDMPMLIAGRTIQGLGGGGIQSLSAIILADLVTLQERGLYAGLFGLVWSIASIAGPVIGGSLATAGQWRWLFFLNLPVCGLAVISVIVFLRLPTPPGTLAEKLARLDWIGNILVVVGTTLCTIALTWGGISAPWNSARVLALLVIGLAVLGIFLVWEAMWATDPLVPFALMSNRTSLSGYLQTFFVGVVALGIVYYMPIYYQGCKDASPTKSGLISLGMSVLAPASIAAGVAVTRTQRYRPQMWAGWCLVLVGLGLYSTLRAADNLGHAVGFSVVLGVGLGAQYSTVPFPVQAPLPVSENAHALAFLQFLRSFAGVWGVTIGGTVLQNELKRRVPPAFLTESAQGSAIAYALIPQVPFLPEPLKREVQDAFAGSLRVLWEVLLGIGAAGLLSSLLMKGLPLHTSLDEDWAMTEPRTAGEKGVDEEKSLPVDVIGADV
ncbi:MFS general substrate transporter [Trametes coccinea BRFM310]|uniref:MFS general substrate transporter n=1 Tax=Trametes coccinea (strain BRFM310) TaxID=1353009 RepID=A0A1Y2IMI0_TRAC3|nr:MFS general substrate transporter [Trametes coccinea BRFM310]